MRLSSQTTSGEFFVSELRPDELLVRSDSLSEVMRVPTRSVFEIERHEGRRSWAVAALQGAGVGAMGGAVVGLLTRSGEEIRLPGQPTGVRLADGRDGPRAREERASGPNFIGTEELRGLVDHRENLYRLLQRTPSNWLRTHFIGGRQEAPDVYVDGARVGGLGVLGSYTVRAVRSIEFIDSTDASSPFNSVMGVISIRTGSCASSCIPPGPGSPLEPRKLRFVAVQDLPG